jgi:hypothetical protein
MGSTDKKVMTTKTWGSLGSIALGAACLFWATAAHAGLPFRFDTPQGWKQVETVEGLDGMWSAGDSHATAVTVFTHTAEEYQDFEGVNLKLFVETLTRARNLIQGVYGIENWKVEKQSIVPIDGSKGFLIKLTGHYSGVKHQKVKFTEWQYYSGRQYYQVTYATEGASLKGAERALAGFAPTLEAK